MQADIKGSVVCNADSEGCHQYINEQWNRLKDFAPGQPLKSVLVIGCSSGFGLASRLNALRNGAEFSIGICYEKPASEHHAGSAGWHLDQAFHKIADQQRHNGTTLNQDAFLKKTKEDVIELCQRLDQKFDLVIYSVAAGIKLDDHGEKIRSSILPTDTPLDGFQVDLGEHSLSRMTLPPATQNQIDDTVAIMGGDDWNDWMQTLEAADVLSKNCVTYNYSYLGSDLNAAIYRNGTLGAAKDHMHQVAATLRDSGFEARAVVCKALVTKASLFIPLMAPYLMALKSELTARNHDENVFDQMRRLLAGQASADGDLLRLDEYELDEEVQASVKARLAQVTENNFKSFLDYDGVRNELLEMHGFYSG